MDSLKDKIVKFIRLSKQERVLAYGAEVVNGHIILS